MASSFSETLEKFNPNHDAKTGQFTTGTGGKARAALVKEERRIYNKKIEHGIIVDEKSGVVIGRAKGTETTIKWPREVMDKIAGSRIEGRRFILTHNHPSHRTGGVAYALSGQDILMAGQNGLAGVRAVGVGKDGGVSLSQMTFPAKESKAMLRRDKVFGHHRWTVDVAIAHNPTSVWNEMYRHGLPKTVHPGVLKKPEHVAIYRKVMHSRYTKLAKKYGWEYTYRD